MSHSHYLGLAIALATLVAYGSIFALTGTELLNSLPILLVLTIAMIMAINRWPRHPRVSLFMITGSAVLVLTMVAAAWSQGHLVVQSLLWAEGLSFVCAAAFLDR